MQGLSGQTLPGTAGERGLLGEKVRVIKSITPEGSLSESATRHERGNVKCFFINMVSYLLCFRVTGETKVLVATKERE